MAGSGELRVDRSAGDRITVRLSGRWALAHPLPPAEQVLRELQADPPARGVGFEASDLESWDSAVLTFLVEIEDACAERGVPTDREGLPTGLRRICLLYTSPSPRDVEESRMPSSA